jgi:hypothetical protein
VRYFEEAGAIWKTKVPANGQADNGRGRYSRLAEPGGSGRARFPSWPAVMAGQRIGGLRATSRRIPENANQFGQRHQFRQVSGLHLLHHPVAMSFDCTFGTT